MGYEEFEGRSLDALYAMVSSGKPAELTGVGEILSKVGKEVEGIAEALREFIPRVEWEGEAADAFRDWGDGMVLETRRLGEFSKVMSVEMTRAGQALTEAQAAVPTPAGQCFTDPEKEAERLADEKGKREEAINQLHRLSSFYDVATNRMAAEPEPNFRPIIHHDIEPGPLAPTASMGSGDNGVSPPRITTVSAADSTTGHSTASRPADGSTSLRQEVVNTQLDAVAPPTATPHQRHGEPTLVNPTTSNSSEHAGSPFTAPGASRSMSDLGRRSRGPGSMSRQPQAPVSKMPRVGSADGIVGGRPQQSDRQSDGARIPRGTVVGDDQRPMGRGPMGGAAAAPRGTGRGTDSAHPAGRLVSRPGGVVGDPRVESRGRGGFTPGGSGLLRNSGAPMGAAPRSGRQQTSERPGSKGRPDYLTEEEDTWSNDRRSTTPPVID